MAFKSKESTVAVPTHLKWIVANPELKGSTHDIVTILRNAEWKTVTYFTETFKLNVKMRTDDDYCKYVDEMIKVFKRGYVKATITDSSDLEKKRYEADVFIDAMSQEKGGRHYEFGKNRITIDIVDDKSDDPI